MAAAGEGRQQRSLILDKTRSSVQSHREGLSLREARGTSFSETGGHCEAWVWWEGTGVPGLLPLTSGRLGHQLSGVGVEKGRQLKGRMRRF